MLVNFFDGNRSKEELVEMWEALGKAIENMGIIRISDFELQGKLMHLTDMASPARILTMLVRVCFIRIDECLKANDKNGADIWRKDYNRLVGWETKL